MAQSREQLTMDMSKSDSMFSRPSGCHVSRAKGLGLVLLFLLTAVAAAFITHHFSVCSLDLSTSLGNGTESALAHKVRDVRLPTNLRPLYYKVDLIPYVDPSKNFSIDGKVRIQVLCLEDTNRVTLHIKNISITENKVRLTEWTEGSAETGAELTVLKHAYDPPREFYNVTLKEPLQAGKNYELYIEFEAILSDELAGFYRSSYKDKATNETRYVAGLELKLWQIQFSRQTTLP